MAYIVSPCLQIAGGDCFQGIAQVITPERGRSTNCARDTPRDSHSQSRQANRAHNNIILPPHPGLTPHQSQTARAHRTRTLRLPARLRPRTACAGRLCPPDPVHTWGVVMAVPLPLRPGSAALRRKGSRGRRPPGGGGPGRQPPRMAGGLEGWESSDAEYMSESQDHGPRKEKLV